MTPAHDLKILAAQMINLANARPPGSDSRHLLATAAKEILDADEALERETKPRTAA